LPTSRRPPLDVTVQAGILRLLDRPPERARRSSSLRRSGRDVGDGPAALRDAGGLPAGPTSELLGARGIRTKGLLDALHPETGGGR
jgi:hypothetical protein